MKKWMNYLPYALVIIILASLIIFSNDSRTKNYDYSTFVSEAETMNFQQSSLSVGSTVIDVQGTYKDKDGVTQSFTVSVPNTDENIQWLTKILGEGKIAVTDPNRENQFMNIIGSLLPVLIMVGVFLFFFSKMNAGGNNKAFDFAKSRAKIQSNVKVRFKDVAGCDEEKEEVREIIDYLKNPKQFTDMGARIPKGLLMVGPPGTGKTLLAKAVAGEADVPFFSISGSDFVEMFVGTGASRVRDMFKKAQQAAPCIVFIDEIDAVGRQRGAGMGGGNDEREQTLNQLLVEMDGMGENKGIVIIAATNRPDVLDPALLRSGRFDRQITVNLPDKKGREAILRVHARNKKLSKDISLENLAQRTPGFSGADLENVLNEGAILAVRDHRKMITMDDLDEAIDRVMMGPAKKSKKYNEDDKHLVSYHEAGHAVIGIKLEDADMVQKVTIIPRGDAGGYNLMTPREEKYFHRKREYMAQITGLLGGRVAEELVFGEISAGAVNDIEKITKIAKNMVRVFGMSSLGPIQYADPQGNVFLGRDYNNGNNYSAGVAAEIDKEVRKIVDECYADCKRILSENRDLLDLIANSLFEEETLTKEQINNLVEYGTLTSPQQQEEQTEETQDAADIQTSSEEETSTDAEGTEDVPTQPEVSQDELDEAVKELSKKQ
ncbi:ATP-dependent zinc metalloprotease FtsH [Merdibacter massiliensis]|uniref:ATP-dependent zinc metalloprotease FtsH n=1 Tax=Merdibacter massiliensis TaxID=1871030 RepID=UPI00096AA230|nr:ATP-dependent zinc metalloprotease FtsH [Merdibacter massiliensis]